MTITSHYLLSLSHEHESHHLVSHENYFASWSNSVHFPGVPRHLPPFLHPQNDRQKTA